MDEEDKYWVQKAKEAEKEGFIGVEESEKLIAELLEPNKIHSKSDG